MSARVIVNGGSDPTSWGQRPSGVPWTQVGQQWGERDYSLLRQAVRTLEGLSLGHVDGLLEGMPAPPSLDAIDVLRNAFAVASGTPQGALLLVTYVYGQCLNKWERSVDYARIRMVLKSLEEVISDLQPNAAELDENEAKLLRLIVDLAQCMDDAMAVENAMNCSCPVDMARHAQAVVGRATSVLQGEQELSPGFTELREVIRSDAATQRCYFGAVFRVATAVRQFVELEGPGPAPVGFDDVIRAVAIAEADSTVRGDVYESELRAHRVTLRALGDHAASRRLRIDAAEILYIYPFALSGMSAEDAVHHALSAEGGWRPAALAPIDIEQLRLTDMWDVNPAERAYGAAVVKLPTLQVETTAGQHLAGFNPEIRLTRLGNHYLRVRSRLKKSNLHELNQALRRASVSMGEERIWCEGGTWTKFAEYADEVIAGIAKELSTDVVRDASLGFHVVVVAHAISIQEPDGTTTPATIDAIPGAVGASLLLRPLSQLAASLEEWIRYPTPDVVNLVESVGCIDDLVVRTENTTVLFMPASPDWVIDGFEEMVEFVASVPALLMSWEQRAWDHAQKLEKTLPSLQEWIAQPDTVLPIADLLMEEVKLRQLEADIRRDLAFLHSPARSRRHRDFLNAVWTAAGLPTLEDALERQLTVLSTLQERLSTMVSVITEGNRQARQEDIEFFVQLTLGLLAVGSLAELLGWINNTFGIDSFILAASEASALVICVFLITWLFFRKRRER